MSKMRQKDGQAGLAPSPTTFRERAVRALADAQLQRALGNVPRGFIAKRAKALARLPEFEELRQHAAAVKRQALAGLDELLDLFTKQAEKAGCKVHIVASAAEARTRIVSILADHGVRRVAKGKSMISEEIGLNAALEAAGMAVTETDLGEYIIQLRNETPSHIVAPAIHLTRADIAPTFRAAHEKLPHERPLHAQEDFVDEARKVLREVFCSAEAGITGANILIAETGTVVLVTNEGNGDLCATLPRIHIVIASIEKVVPTREDATTLLRVLARSATGQEITTYTSFFTGPRRMEDKDGPEEMHIVLLDNGRSAVCRGPFADILACIRCGACLNHCPVFQVTGGHAYGDVYPGPMGEVLQPALHGLAQTHELADACTMCGRCAEVCPVLIPLPDLIRRWRMRAFAERYAPVSQRWGLKIWGWVAQRPWLYRRLSRLGSGMLRLFAERDGFLKWRLPGLGGWFKVRDLPVADAPPFLTRQHGAFQSARRETVVSGTRWASRNVALDESEARNDLCARNARLRLPGTVADGLVARMHAHPRGPQPKRAHPAQFERLAVRFGEEAERAGAIVETVKDLFALPKAVLSAMNRHGMSGSVHVLSPRLIGLAWEEHRIEIKKALPPCRDSESHVGLILPEAAIAETGSLLTLSGETSPPSLMFLPRVLLAAVPVSTILPSLDDGWDLLRSRFGETIMPRSVHWITGPSRTADIEQTLVLGAHGPAILHIFLIKET